MLFDNMLYLLVASYGLCFGLMNDKANFLTDKLKALPLFKTEKGTFFERMLICAYCTGFHTGWIIYCIALLHPRVSMDWQSNVVEGLIISFASAIFCYSTDVIVQWFER